MSATFALSLSGAPFSSLAPLSAFRFAQAALAQGHTIQQVFLYQDGIYLASRFSNLPADELNLTLAWQELAQAANFPLYVCIAGAVKRGLLSAEEAERQGLLCASLATGYQLASLADLATSISSATRSLHFS